MSVVIARRLLGQHEQEPEKEKKSSSTHRKLPIRGSGGMLVTFANCCRPIPGDAIIAHISPGKGLVVHQESCPNLRGYNREPDKYQPVQWDMEQLGEQEFRTSIVVEVVNHQGVLAQLANVIAATGANIHSISTEEKDAQGSEVARKSVGSSRSSTIGNDSVATEEIQRAVAEYNDNLFWNMRG